MSLARLALRLATVEALRPTASLQPNASWPTLAGKYVFDSRIDPMQDLHEHEARPLIVVYTDEDDAVSAQARGGPPFKITADLCFETSVVVRMAAAGESGGFIVGQPETDGELEASLDMLGAQIAFTLLYAPCGEIFRKVCGRRIIAPKSTVHRTSEEGVRLARRDMLWKVEINSDAFDPAPAQFARGLDVLPEPLRSVARMLPEGSYGRAIVDGLCEAPSAPRMPVRVTLATIGFKASVNAPRPAEDV